MSNTSELKKCVKALCAVISTGEKELSAGNIVAKITNLIGAITGLIPLFSINLAEAKTELAALDEAGRQELLAEVNADLQLGDKAVALDIEAGLALMDEGYSQYSSVSAYVIKVEAFIKSLKPAPAKP